jgi:hypothetical protein
MSILCQINERSVNNVNNDDDVTRQPTPIMAMDFRSMQALNDLLGTGDRDHDIVCTFYVNLTVSNFGSVAVAVWLPPLP